MTSGQLHIQNGTNTQTQIDMASSNQDMLSKGSKKKTMLIVVVVALVVGLAAGLAVLLKSQQSSQPRPLSYRLRGKATVTLEEVIKGHLIPKRFNGTWISDSEILYRREDGSFHKYNAKTASSQLLLAADNEVIKNSFHYELSADGRYMVLAHNYQKLYRHTFLANYLIVDLETKKRWKLTDDNGLEMLLQLVVWSPVGNAFAYVYVNDIYYRTSARETHVQEHRLTHNGRPGTIYNGVPDWVYEEEILGSNKALWFSPDGRHLAFATFNDSQTPVMNIPYYGAPGDLRYQYTQAVNIRYPKPGRPNPRVSVGLANLVDLQYGKPVRRGELPQSMDEPVLYLVIWTPVSKLLVVWMNRVQNKAQAALCTPDTLECRQVLELEEKSGWVAFEEPVFSQDGTKMAFIMPHSQGEAEGNFKHLTLLDLTTTAPVPVPLTSGKFVVTEVLAWDHDTQHIYFLSNVEGAPGQLRVGKVPAKAVGAPHQVECVSCQSDMTSAPYEEPCTYAGASFSKRNSYYVQSCAGPSIPFVALHSKDGRKVTTWEDNRRLRSKLAGKVMPQVEYLTVPISQDMTAYVKLFLPPDLDTSGNTKYPMLVQVYAGPDSSQISERFGIDWQTYLTVNQSLIYAMIDGRGSGLKGNKLLFANYRNLGTLEVLDQIHVTRYLQESRSYIDGKRTAIWGWSYGGYATGMALANDTHGVFKCGISVAPVTDWLLYDTLYTERYMGLPGDNMKGYEAASLSNKVSNFRNKQFLLVHGTLDDNVHYQQSMMLARSLELNDILFDQQSYPDEGHGLLEVRPHLYHSLGHFLNRCFAPS